MRLRVLTLALPLVLLLVSAVSAGEIAIGFGGDPPEGPFVEEDGMINVGPVEVWLDPIGDPWLKQFVIPPQTIVPGQVFRVWEEIIINPPPIPGSILPIITDWHEEIHEVSFNTPFSWGGGSFTIHDPSDPVGPPIVDVPGEISADGSAIWFGPFPMVTIIDPIPVWIHKELVYTGSTTLTPGANPITITVWEHATIPEPSSIVMAIMGLLGLMGFGWMRRRDSIRRR